MKRHDRIAIARMSIHPGLRRAAGQGGAGIGGSGRRMGGGPLGALRRRRMAISHTPRRSGGQRNPNRHSSPTVSRPHPHNSSPQPGRSGGGMVTSEFDGDGGDSDESGDEEEEEDELRPKKNKKKNLFEEPVKPIKSKAESSKEGESSTAVEEGRIDEEVENNKTEGETGGSDPPADNINADSIHLATDISRETSPEGSSPGHGSRRSSKTPSSSVYGEEECEGNELGGSSAGSQKDEDYYDDYDRCQCLHICTKPEPQYAKAYVVTINVILFMLGWLLMLIGVWLYFYHETVTYSALLQESEPPDGPTHIVTLNSQSPGYQVRSSLPLPTPPVVVIDRLILALVAVGLVVTSTGFVGCCGACTETNYCLGVFIILILTSLITQFILTLVIVSTHQQIRQSMLTSMTYQIRYEYNRTGRQANGSGSRTERLTKAWDNLQVSLNCCGVYGPQDYHNSAWFNETSHSTSDFVPASCCLSSSPSPVTSPSTLRLSGTTHPPYDLISTYSAQQQRVMKLEKALDRVDYICQIQAIQFIFSKSHYDIAAIRTQGCAESLFQYLMSLLCLIILVIAIDAVQITTLICACSLIVYFREQHRFDIT